MLALYEYFDDYKRAQETVLDGTKIYLATVDICLKALANQVGGATKTLFNNRKHLGIIVDEYQRLPSISLHAFLAATPALLAVGDHCQELVSLQQGRVESHPWFVRESQATQEGSQAKHQKTSTLRNPKARSASDFLLHAPDVPV